MSPLEIEILIHYYVVVDMDYDPLRLDAPAVKEAIERFLSMNLLEHNIDKNLRCKYVGNMVSLRPYISALCKVPLPVLKWVVVEE